MGIKKPKMNSKVKIRGNKKRIYRLFPYANIARM